MPGWGSTGDKMAAEARGEAAEYISGKIEKRKREWAEKMLYRGHCIYINVGSVDVSVKVPFRVKI